MSNENPGMDPTLTGGSLTPDQQEVERMYASQAEKGSLDTSFEGQLTYFNDKGNWALPEPDMLRAASGTLAGYFSGVSETGNFDEHFAENVDSVVSAVGGLLEERYEKLPRDQATDQEIQDRFGRAVANAQAAAGKPGSSSLRPEPDNSRYIDIRTYTRNSEKNPDAFPELAKVGQECSIILGLAADAIRTTPLLDKDSSSSQGQEAKYSNLKFNDYVLRHVGLTIKDIAELQPQAA